ncbi:hypothetical protein Sp245p_20630 (plasmid) [Azospirillum baldaniorum]|uniref:Uncharacterized protein n=1 Tax=Azospirillum baldaniorum TaxID=1064539 RepID=A0A9P1JVM3_9PROT|nr:hypothetical protein Sp245p_20630 [Azospirillum baldaniorum]CCD00673.1 protein of unknown function [Azospirillum baldaniorum]
MVHRCLLHLVQCGRLNTSAVRIARRQWRYESALDLVRGPDGADSMVRKNPVRMRRNARPAPFRG